ncbi:non-ribosomal peptide synthetase [Streptomyces sp. Edi2]|uniref:non-ribosomal peptide synthetase n=1 Tax=Streptomyces sp. Edi2 TaxID=3162528 RepID=UPI0033067B20
MKRVRVPVSGPENRSLEISPFQCMHHLFEAQAMATPDHTAVVLGDQQLSYRQLDARANQLANFLLEHGLQLDSPVALCMDRSPDLVVALLAILKAGGAYVPLDPTVPSNRLNQILDEAGVRFCIGDNRYRSHLATEAFIICPDSDWPVISSFSEASPAVPVTPHNLVSVYFTSGSTGTPKGVGSTHLGWVNRMLCMQQEHQLQPGETVLHKTTLTFDDSALELFWPLAFGGRVALVRPGAHKDPRAVLEAAARYGTILLQVVPSMLNMVLDVIEEDAQISLPKLRCTVSSGEALLPATVARFFESMPGELHNTWGATEVSIDSTTYTCSPADGLVDGSVSIGLPFANNQVYVLNKDLDPVPTGVVGDIYMGGIGLARGYLGDPAKTAENFIPHPLHSGERMYRSGDRGYFDAHHCLRYAGREDHQVKIRGMRVELGDIEAVISRHPLVKEAVAGVRESANGLKRLVAYVTHLHSRRRVSADELRDHVSRHLADYMRPSSFFFLEQMPLNGSGKVDRGKLSALDDSLATSNEIYTAPRGVVEEELADIFASILDVQRVSVTDNFFHLGGESLLAVRVVNRVGQKFGVELPLARLFESPTVSSLAVEVGLLLKEKISNLSQDEMSELLGDSS